MDTYKITDTDTAAYLFMLDSKKLVDLQYNENMNVVEYLFENYPTIQADIYNYRHADNCNAYQYAMAKKDITNRRKALSKLLFLRHTSMINP